MHTSHIAHLIADHQNNSTSSRETSITLYTSGLLSIVGFGLCVASALSNVGREYWWVGVGGLLVGSTLGWMAEALAAGRLRAELENKFKEEVTESFRLRTKPSPLVSYLIVVLIVAILALFAAIWLFVHGL